LEEKCDKKKSKDVNHLGVIKIYRVGIKSEESCVGLAYRGIPFKSSLK